MPPLPKKRMSSTKTDIHKRNALNKINRQVQHDIKKSLPSPKVLREAESLSPAKRKRFLKKLAVSFAKGAAVTAGVAVTIGVTYKLSKKSIHKEIKSAVKTATDEATQNIQKNIPGISEQLRNEVGTTITQINPAIEETINNTVDNATKQVMQNVKENESHLMDTANKIAGSAVEGAQEKVAGPLSFVLGGGKKKKDETPPSSSSSSSNVVVSNPENKNKNLKKQVDTANIITTPTGTPEGQRVTRSRTKPANNTTPEIQPEPEPKKGGEKKKVTASTSTNVSIAPEIEPAKSPDKPLPKNSKELWQASLEKTKEQGGPNIQEVEFGKRKRKRKHKQNGKGKYIPKKLKILHKDLNILIKC